MRRYNKGEFACALRERGFAKSIAAARRYCRKFPKKVYKDDDFRRACDWLEQNDRFDLPGCGYNIFPEGGEAYAD